MYQSEIWVAHCDISTSLIASTIEPIFRRKNELCLHNACKRSTLYYVPFVHIIESRTKKDHNNEPYDQRAKSVLWMSFVSGRARLLEENFPGAWSQDSFWYQETAWNSNHVFGFITATYLLMVHLLRAVW